MVLAEQIVFKKTYPINKWMVSDFSKITTFEKIIASGGGYERKKDRWQKLKIQGVIAGLEIVPEKKSPQVSRLLREEFCSNLLKWKEETKFSSSMHEIVLNKAYQRIIGLGPAVIPLIFEDLRDYGGHWFWALNALTGENPVHPEDAGRIKKITEAWLAWGRSKGFLQAFRGFFVFPNLTNANHQITSPATHEYNCIAWAAKDDERWWWPFGAMGGVEAYWPPSAPKILSVDSFIAAFATLGYKVSSNGNLEDWKEKVVIYTNAIGEPTHMARQLPSGLWTSKMGQWNDIGHTDTHAVEGPTYGNAVTFLQRNCYVNYNSSTYSTHFIFGRFNLSKNKS